MGCRTRSGGHGLPKNERKAFKLFLRAAELGSMRACNNLSNAYEKGVAVKDNKAKQRYFLKKVARLGLVEARHNLGAM